jgi:phosphodiesterase/alkaline phosphatase D-like protein/sugar lactone lactonase YvrE
VSNPSHALRSLFHRLGVAGPARVRAFQGTGAGGRALISRSVILSALAMTLGALAFTAAPALAVEGLGPLSTFYGPVESFVPRGVAVDNSAAGAYKGDVYVADTANNVVDRFSATGASQAQITDGFSGPTGVAVDSSGNVYVVDTGNNVVKEFDPSTSLRTPIREFGTGQLNAPTGVAVDSSGDVFVADTGENVVKEYKPAKPTEPVIFGELVLSAPTGVAVLGDGYVYVVDSAHEVHVFNGTGVAQASLSNPTGAQPVAVGASSAGGLYMAHEDGEIVQYDSAGHVLDQSYAGAISLCTGFGCGFRVGSSATVFGIAAGSAGDVYVSNSWEWSYVERGVRNHEAVNQVVVFQPAALPEALTGTPATEVEATTATLPGEVNPGGAKVASCNFEYGETAGYGQAVACEQSTEAIGSGTSNVKVTAKLTGLQPHKTYHYALAASNGDGVNYGADQTLTTLDEAPKVANESVSAESVKATFGATINPNNEETTYEFEYATTEAALLGGTGTKVAGTLPPTLEGYGELTVSVHTVAALSPSTTYFYRAKATNATGTSHGTVQSFTTVPTPTTEAPSPIGTTTATFKGTLTPLNSTVAAEYAFDYDLGEEAICTNEQATTPESAGTGTGAKAVATAVTGLQPNQKYTVCLVSINAFGSEEALTPIHFTTKPLPPEVIPTTESATNVKASEATLGALINPNNQSTTYEFEYSTIEAEVLGGHGTKVAGGPLTGFGGQSVNTTLTGLTHHTTYYYRVVAENATNEKALPGKVESFITGPLETPTEGLEANPVGPTTATLKGVLNPGGAVNPGTYEFLYAQSATACEGGVSTPAEPATGAQQEPAEAEIEGLLPHVTYTFCLRAHHESEVVTSTPVTFSTPAIPPAIESESSFSTEVTSDSATLHAEVNPGGAATTYHFEYGTSSVSEHSTPESPSIGSDDTGHPAEARIQLAADTLYHYRIVASNSLSPGGVPGPDRTFTTQSHGTLVLPDGRGWEMVTPPDKAGGLILPIFNVHQAGGTGYVRTIEAAAGGDGITYSSPSPTESQPPGSAQATQVLSLRGPSGWETRDISSPHTEATAVSEETEYPYVSEDLSHAVLDPLGPLDPSLSSEASEQTAFLRTNFLNGNAGDPCVESCYRPLATGAAGFANVPPGTEFGIKEGETVGAETCPPAFYCGPQYVAASPDLSHIVVESRVALTGGPSAEEGLFEWSGGSLKFVGFGEVGEGVAGTLHYYFTIAASAHAVSDDGSRVVFKGSPEGRGGLLLRDTAIEETVPLGSSGNFLFMSANGSKVFMGGAGSPLEECEIAKGASGKLQCNQTGTPTDLTPGASILAPILGASEDGSYVYFISNGVLTGAEQDARGEAAVPGDCSEGEPYEVEPSRCNVYVDHDGVIKLVAVVSGADADARGNADANKAPFHLTARVSPDGRWLAFESHGSPTGYDNRDASSGQPDGEIYLYHAPGGGGEAGTLVCASCNPTGARPDGGSSVPAWTTQKYQSRYLSNGGRLFFDSSDALVPQDTNGAEDVYQYEPPEGGEESPANDTCTTQSSTYGPASAGCVSLISSGTAPEPSSFMDASESGDDVFFRTAARLSTRDEDSAYDIYDARVGGGEPEPTKPVECQGDACQNPVGAPEDLTPGSLTFSGPGNPTPPPPAAKTTTKRATKCAKGKRLEHGKCVKQKAKPKKKKKAKKSTKRGK